MTMFLPLVSVDESFSPFCTKLFFLMTRGRLLPTYGMNPEPGAPVDEFWNELAAVVVALSLSNEPF